MYTVKIPQTCTGKFGLILKDFFSPETDFILIFNFFSSKKKKKFLEKLFTDLFKIYCHFLLQLNFQISNEH